MNANIHHAKMVVEDRLKDMMNSNQIVRFEEWGGFPDEEGSSDEEDSLCYVVYAGDPRSIERTLVEFSSELTRQYNIPILIFTFKDA
mgnify:CR=1 FL=1